MIDRLLERPMYSGQKELQAPEQIGELLFNLSESYYDHQNNPAMPDSAKASMRYELTKYLNAQLARQTDQETAVEFDLQPIKQSDGFEIGSKYGEATYYDIKSIIVAYDELYRDDSSSRDAEAALVVLTQIAVTQPDRHQTLLMALNDKEFQPGKLKQLVGKYMNEQDDRERGEIGSQFDMASPDTLMISPAYGDVVAEAEGVLEDRQDN